MPTCILGPWRTGKVSGSQFIRSVFPSLETFHRASSISLTSFFFFQFQFQKLNFTRQSGLRSIWDKYYREADSVLFVVDCSAEDRLAESMEVLGKLNKRKQEE